jgi:hypothetical protein
MDNKLEFTRFRELLQSLENSDTTIRLRLLGNPWTSACTLILLSESAMILQESNNRKIIMNLRNVVEFEVGEPVAGLQANQSYEIEY